MYHHCGIGGYHQTFMCPNGTLYSELTQNCDYWFKIDCKFHAKQNKKNNEYLISLKTHSTTSRPMFYFDKFDQSLQALRENLVEKSLPISKDTTINHRLPLVGIE